MSKQFKGTPGPWFEHREGFSTVYIEAKLRDGVVQEVAACGPTEAGESSQLANAKLIASAPELLEALQLLFASYKQLADSGDAGNWAIEDYPEGKAAIAAINKALGE